MTAPALRTSRIWLCIWLAVAIALATRAAGRREGRGVILDHLEFGRRLLQGDDVYGPWRSDHDAPLRPLHAPYPPSFGLLTAPFAVVADTMGTRAARALWAILQIACLAAAALVLRRHAAPRAPPHAGASHWHWLWLGTFLLSLRFLLRETHGGGGNSINLAFCLLAFDAAERERPRAAGWWLGLSLATKPTQIWLLPVFLLLGRGRAVLCSLVAGASLVLLTVLLQRFDAGPWLRWIEGSWRLGTQADAFAPPALDFPPFEWMNQSLRCAIARWCGTVPDEFARKVPSGVVPGLGLPVPAVMWLTRALSLGALALVLAAATRARASATARLWVFAAALVLSVLLSPLSWKAHHVALLPVLFLLLQRAAAPGPRRGVIALLCAWAVCCLPGAELIGDAADEWLNSIYVITAFDAVLLGTAVAAARSAALQDGDAPRGAGRGERLG